MATVVSRWVAPAIALAALLVGVVFLVAQSRDEGPAAAGPTTSPSMVIEAGQLTGEEDEAALREFAVFSRVPAEADRLTITDLDAIRARLGVPDLTSQALGTDATIEEQDAVLAAHDAATAWLGLGRDDLVDRAALTEDWPTLTEILPFGICNEVTPMAEPIGL